MKGRGEGSGERERILQEGKDVGDGIDSGFGKEWRVGEGR